MFSLRSLFALCVSAVVLLSPLSQVDASCPSGSIDHIYSGVPLCSGRSVTGFSNGNIASASQPNHGDGVMQYLQTNPVATLCMWECTGDGTSRAFYRGQITTSTTNKGYGYLFTSTYIIATDSSSYSTCYKISLGSGWSYVQQTSSYAATSGDPTLIQIDGSTGTSCSGGYTYRRRLLQAAWLPSGYSGATTVATNYGGKSFP